MNMENIKNKWDDIINYMIEEFDISSVSYDTFIVPLKPVKVTDKAVYILAEDKMCQNYCNKRFKKFLTVSIEIITGESLDPIFITQEELEEQAPKAEIEKKQEDVLNSDLISEANLNPKYTFSTFVVGPTNKLAHAASVAVAESPGQAYKILYIYGGVGLGKTHLMHAAAHYILKNNPKSKILYNTCETFMNDYIESIQNKKSAEFRKKYRDLDVLLIDDIQFISGKESTQEEFFHTFNSLYDRNKQIIITSDKPPKEIDNLEERLRSRFEGGLIVDIQPPDYETRMAILRKKEESMGNVNIDDEVIKYIADSITSNIRELEGALTRIVAKSKLEKIEIDLDMAKRILKDYIGTDNPQNRVSTNYIISLVAEHFGLSSDDLRSKKKTQDLYYPRQIAIYLCCTLTKDSLQQIGKAMGGKHHSTVIHDRNKIAKELETDEKIKSIINILKKKIVS